MARDWRCASLPSTTGASIASLPNGGLESIHVGLDGRSIDRWRPGKRHGYLNYIARLPPDPERRHISTITLQFDASTADDFIAKLDRISIRPE